MILLPSRKKNRIFIYREEKKKKIKIFFLLVGVEICQIWILNQI